MSEGKGAFYRKVLCASFFLARKYQTIKLQTTEVSSNFQRGSYALSHSSPERSVSYNCWTHWVPTTLYVFPSPAPIVFLLLPTICQLVLVQSTRPISQLVIHSQLVTHSQLRQLVPNSIVPLVDPSSAPAALLVRQSYEILHHRRHCDFPMGSGSTEPGDLMPCL